MSNVILSRLSKKLLLNESDLWKFLSSAPHRYKKYRIEKRNGKGFREIAQPSKELKFVQNTVINNFELFSSLPIHNAAKAYRKNLNIKDNAEAHKSNSYLLKMDFSNFFPSIRPSDLISHIEKFGKIELNNLDKQVVSKLFFYDKYRNSNLVLSIGAPTSPYISNTVMYDFDGLVEEFCKKNEIVYTRYADDLTFSTSKKGVLFEIPEFIELALKDIAYPKLSINVDKTVFLSKRNNRHITGLVVSNEGGVSIGRKKKRYIKSLVYKFCKNELEKKEILYLQGYLAFCSGIDKVFVLSLENKYGKNNIKLIRSFSEG